MMKILLMFLILVISFNARATDHFGLQSITPAIQAPNFTLKDIDGKTIQLSDFRGKIVIVNFWATWCPPCREEIPSMNEAMKKLNNKKFVMLGINMAEEADTVLEFSNNTAIDFTVLLDTTGEASAKWPMKGLPTTFIVNPQGKIIYRAIGSRDWSSDSLLKELQKLLK
jgi:peroxiredoxin